MCGGTGWGSYRGANSNMFEVYSSAVLAKASPATGSRASAGAASPIDGSRPSSADFASPLSILSSEAFSSALSASLIRSFSVASSSGKGGRVQRVGKPAIADEQDLCGGHRLGLSPEVMAVERRFGVEGITLRRSIQNATKGIHP